MTERTEAVPVARPRWWPRFSSTVRSTALTARLGRVLGICIGISFLTGLLSLYQYEPWSWLPVPASPVWGYRLTQGVHVATGTATIPLVLIKLWSVYPNTFRWPPFRSVKRVIERVSLAILVGSILVQLTTGFLNVLNWYPFPWDFVSVHHYLAYVVVGSVLLHVGREAPRHPCTGCRPRWPRVTCSPRSRGTRTRSRTAMPATCRRRSRRASPGAACSRRPGPGSAWSWSPRSGRR